jgi:hypothetical protein
LIVCEGWIRCIISGRSCVSFLNEVCLFGSHFNGLRLGGKDVTVGAAKGAGKIRRGIGKAAKKLF